MWSAKKWIKKINYLKRKLSSYGDESEYKIFGFKATKRRTKAWQKSKNSRKRINKATDDEEKKEDIIIAQMRIKTKTYKYIFGLSSDPKNNVPK